MAQHVSAAMVAPLEELREGSTPQERHAAASEALVRLLPLINSQVRGRAGSAPGSGRTTVADVEDACQEASLRMLEALQRLTRPGSPVPKAGYAAYVAGALRIHARRAFQSAERAPGVWRAPTSGIRKDREIRDATAVLQQRLQREPTAEEVATEATERWRARRSNPRKAGTIKMADVTRALAFADDMGEEWAR